MARVEGVQKQRSLLLWLIVLGFFLTTSACIEPEHAEEDLFEELPDENAEKRQLGEQLYSTNCSSCHSTIARTNKKNITMERLKFGLFHVPAMSSLKNKFDDSELEAIVIALSPVRETPPTEDAPDTPTEQPPTLPEEEEGGPSSELIAQGKAIYQSRCTSCHGVSGLGGNILGVAYTPEQLGNYFSSVGSMNFLSSMSMKDKTALSGYFTSTVPKAGGDEEKEEEVDSSAVVQRYNIGSRYLLKSRFENLFLPTSGSEKTAIQNVINDLIEDQSSYFGGPCFDYDVSSGGCTRTEEAAASTLPLSNTVRSGFIHRACSETLDHDQALEALLGRVGLSATDSVTVERIKMLWEAMLRTSLHDGAEGAFALNAVLSVSQKLANDGESVFEQWRMTALTLCRSPMMEAI